MIFMQGETVENKAEQIISFTRRPWRRFHHGGLVAILGKGNGSVAGNCHGGGLGQLAHVWLA
jgi:hypothetical protein